MCFVYKRELDATSNVLESLLLKSTKYDWALKAHQVALKEREMMANCLFEQLCHFDEERYYYDLFTSALETQISQLMSKL